MLLALYLPSYSSHHSSGSKNVARRTGPRQAAFAGLWSAVWLQASLAHWDFLGEGQVLYLAVQHGRHQAHGAVEHLKWG